MPESPRTAGRVTLPVQQGMDEELRSAVSLLGADAVRNSDGTELPALVSELGAAVYSTYFPARGDQAWALANPDSRPHFYVMTDRVTATGGVLRIRVLDGWFEKQLRPDTGCQVSRWWQVMDRTSGEEVPSEKWRVEGEGADAVVVLEEPTAWHVYTVSFLATQEWDSTQMYNYLTNNWQDDPARNREIGYDMRHPATWKHMLSVLEDWLEANPHVDVVRFTTFFYHFTLMFGADGRERFVDWFGYSGSVSVAAMEEFERLTGRRLSAEDFVDEGYYNSPFRQPTPAFRQWIDYQHGVVTSKAGELVERVHAAGREAMMFLGDNWIGMEPYGPHFAAAGLDAVVGSVGSAATCRMISDIPHVATHEGRFLPYFFPDVFNPAGDPLGEANENWLAARRAILRRPLERIGYGGYLSLAAREPAFMERIGQICQEFRDIHERSAGRRPAAASFKVGVLNAWGKLRSWQTHMVAHALPYRVTEPYSGVLEALAGLPVEVEFVSFDDVRGGVPEGLGVLLNYGAAGTAFSGGAAWEDPQLQCAVREFVARGGGFIGIGEPTAAARSGAVFQLSDVLGVDREFGWSLSTDRYPAHASGVFVSRDCGDLGAARWGASPPDVVPLDTATVVLAEEGGMVRLAARHFHSGRSVYLAGLPFSAENTRLLHRALFWAAGRQDELVELALADDARVEVTLFGDVAAICNVSAEPVCSEVSGPWGTLRVALAPMEVRWVAF